MAKKPLFSIIIPTYNNARRLENALESVRNQIFRDFEVIVCDDGSTDNTKDLIFSFSGKLDINYIRQDNWGGPARPRNNGIKAARGEYIAFLDSDDCWYPSKLQIANYYLNKGDILYHDLDIHTPQGRRLFKKVKGRHLRKPVFADLMKNENALITSSVVVRKNIIEKAGGFSEEISSLPLTCVEDFDLWLKIARLTDKFVYIPDSLGVYWVGGNNVSQASERLIKRLNAVYGRFIPLLEEEDRKQAQMLKAYLLARTKQKMGLLKESIDLFRSSINSRNKRIKLRSFVWIIWLKYLLNQKNKSN